MVAIKVEMMLGLENIKIDLRGYVFKYKKIFLKVLLFYLVVQ